MSKIFGIHAVQMALAAGQGMRLIVREGKLNQRQENLIELARTKGCDVVREEVASGGNVADQGVALEIRVPAFRSEQALKQSTQATDHPLYLILDGITDPRNFGACLRSAASFGVSGVIVPKDNSAPLNDAAIKTASGAASLVPIYQVVNLSRCLDALKKDNVWVVGAVLGAEQALSDVDLKGPMALVMGAEDSGIRQRVREKCDFLAEIPTSGPELSLNVSVATGICLYEAHKQRT
ncbi:MAG: 23S rRNA (guanosine(2251)-2'-O)-methyltransferase RlmB [Pseudomonadales bacterium]|nr:23S rRNA (guanosine(2251)-2'-O)-methyltransferase RlmB [Pseudomonadales bacterium]MBO6597400.1 23S rRNA (guanosine(2251)-2'-O)-methyltransferase RlmB [Pseudomonadales bacterium]MBO6703105.1 23S rRNA (guanosine(2251)-2'-O)-methyltransferase RlmB [Pseudomonadales bacterium]MBO6824134.1 23S rRNA (guanosine(2251)-2'-O)-methyltransferase RlmB [Pseudomonadales bacterium]MBO7006772.1 23S rRNA (guanosine(2251)-2'-O)-methyltransferase RlmB [Pseudomonadales bacterium]